MALNIRWTRGKLSCHNRLVAFDANHSGRCGIGIVIKNYDDLITEATMKELFVGSHVSLGETLAIRSHFFCFFLLFWSVFFFLLLVNFLFGY